MKKLSVLAALLILMVSCNEMSDDIGNIELLNKANSELVFLGRGGQKTIALVTDADWTASSDADWCQISPEQGDAEECRVKLTIEANDKAREREAVVTFSTARSSVSVTVIQREMLAVIVDEADFRIDAEGGTFEVELEYNVDYEVRIPKSADWIRMVETKKMSSACHEFVVDANTSAEERTAYISFVSDDAEMEEICVVQKGSELTSFDISIVCTGSSFVLPYITGEFTGSVFWGDGSSATFSPMLGKHEYSAAGEHTIEIRLTGNPEELVLEFADIKGLSAVDLTGF